MFELFNPNWLWLLLILIPYIAYEIFIKQTKKAKIQYSRVDFIKKISSNSKLKYLSLILRSLAIVLLIIALARPRYANKKQQITGEGIDIILAIDVSGSMQAVDFKPKNRLEAAKEVAQNFINKRRNDRIGLVTFSDNAFTQCPLTLDYDILMKLLKNVKIDKEANGTAIGMGLANSVARLKDSQAKSKVIILITDGRNNTGEIDPFSAADFATTYGIKVYTIGVGSRGQVDFPVQTPYGIRYQKVKIDMDIDTLNQIASMTGTRRVRLARNTEELKEILINIDKLEKSKIEIKNYYQYKETFMYFLFMAFVLMLIDFLQRTIFRFKTP